MNHGERNHESHSRLDCLRIWALLALPIIAVSCSSAPADAPIEVLLEQAQSNATFWKTAFFIALALYIFIYIMGRRRLMRKIWKRNRELRDALERADEANQMKSAFIRSMSHEIRTPLNAINGFSQLLCSTDIEIEEAEKEDMRQRISNSVDAITEIINELLELAQNESDASAQKMSEVHPAEVCREVLKAAEAHNTKGLVLSFDNQLDETFTLHSNREMIRQMVTKIMDNALKFTDSGTITMTLRKTDGHNMEIAVADTGTGIPTEKQQSVFDNFVKLDDYKDGVGLGLPICRRIARMLGGSVDLDSTYTGGSRFVITLPIK